MKYEICYGTCDGEVFEVDSAQELIEDVKDFIKNYSPSNCNDGCIRITVDKIY